MGKEAVMQKSGVTTVKNVSKGPLMLGALGHKKIAIDAGKSHTFDTPKAYAPFKAGVESLLKMAVVEVSTDGTTKAAPETPALDDHKLKMDEAAKKAADAKAEADAKAAAEAEAKAKADAEAAAAAEKEEKETKGKPSGKKGK